MEQLLEKIKLLSIKEKKTLEQMGLKLSEEVGETSQALLSYLQVSGSEYKRLNLSDVKEECADVILVALSLFFKLSEADHGLKEIIEKKVAKWEAVMPS